MTLTEQNRTFPEGLQREKVPRVPAPHPLHSANHYSHGARRCVVLSLGGKAPWKNPGLGQRRVADRAWLARSLARAPSNLEAAPAFTKASQVSGLRGASCSPHCELTLGSGPLEPKPAPSGVRGRGLCPPPWVPREPAVTAGLPDQNFSNHLLERACDCEIRTARGLVPFLP